MTRHFYKPIPGPGGYMAAGCTGCSWAITEPFYLNSDVDDVLSRLKSAYKNHIVLLGNMP